MYRLGATFAIEAIPMMKAVGELSELSFEWHSWNNLVNSFLEGRLDAILCPPLVAVDFPGTIVIPGVGISSKGKIPSPVLYVRGGLEDIEALGIRAKYSYWKKWFDVVMACLEIDCRKVYIVEDGKVFDGKAVVDDADDVQFVSEGYSVINIGELWKRVAPDFPIVCWVWMCRRGSEHRQIRMLLGKIWEKAKQNLFEYVNGGGIDLDFVSLTDQRGQMLEDVYYMIASAEVDSIRWALEQAKKFELVDKDTDFVLC